MSSSFIFIYPSRLSQTCGEERENKLNSSRQYEPFIQTDLGLEIGVETLHKVVGRATLLLRPRSVRAAILALQARVEADGAVAGGRAADLLAGALGRREAAVRAGRRVPGRGQGGGGGAT